ncbi:MAG: methylmalonyl-CoA epimerase [Acidobacteria bacterium]|nr:methylmalonyl-CoA epimerase [Acidobacteriota bacterium]
MKITKLDHIAIAVRSLENALLVYQDALGIECAGREHVPGEAVNVAFLPVGGTRIELLEPSDPGSVLARSIEGRGEGLHHVCFEVDDLHGALEELRARGCRVLDEREGAGGTRVAFVHPKSTGGVLIELRQTS